MRKRKCLLAGLLLMASVLAGATATAEQNLLPGGEFEEENPAWGLYVDGGAADMKVEEGELKIQIEDPGTYGHSVQLYCDGFELLEGGRYRLSFDASSSQKRKVKWRLQMNGGDFTAYAGDNREVNLDTETEHYSYDFTMNKKTDRAPRLCMNLGDAGRVQRLEGHEIVIDNMNLELMDDSKVVVEEAEEVKGPAKLLVNQVGYRTGDKKTVILRDASLDETFEIIDTASGNAVYTGTFAEELSGGSSNEVTKTGEFTEFQTPGSYLIRSANAGESYPFTIADDVYVELMKDTVRMLTMQRCGMALDEELAGEHAHPACHTELATIYGTEEEIDVSGGWHDAGDYGRYTVPAAKTVADMMLAYEAFPQIFDKMDVPEEYSILSEARYELEWMMKMQTAEGGVYHKVTGLNFDGVVMPEACTAKLYVLPVSVASTGDFAASMYMASRIYRDVDAEFADRCKAAADLAYDYLLAHKDEKGFVNPSDCVTGEYGDEDLRDEYLWAVAERYKTTGEEELLALLGGMPIARMNATSLGWADMTGYALYAYLTTEGAPENKVIYDAFIKGADYIKNVIAKDSYYSSIPNDYPWGSNMTIANNGMILLMTAQLTGDASYTAAARTQLDYLLGINTTGYCFVSGYGTLCMENPHHRPSQFKKMAVKGMLSGGPNNGLQDPCAASVLRGYAKANCYVDNDQSYSTNEIAIYWNSPLIYLLAGIMED